MHRWKFKPPLKIDLTSDAAYNTKHILSMKNIKREMNIFNKHKMSKPIIGTSPLSICFRLTSKRIKFKFSHFHVEKCYNNESKMWVIKTFFFVPLARFRVLGKFISTLLVKTLEMQKEGYMWDDDAKRAER